VDGEQRIREIFGELVVVLPYVMPGFELARLCAEEFPKRSTGRTIGMVLLHHGIFSFADTARESYERMIALVGKAEDFLNAKKAWSVAVAPAAPSKATPIEIPELRKQLSKVAGFPVIVRRYTDSKSLGFARRKDAADIATRGPATPDHVIRTKRLPMIGRDVAKYAKDYAAYFEGNNSRARENKKILDAAPRIVVDRELGVLSIGRSAREASVAGEIYAHTIEIISRAELLGGYRALPEQNIFDVEYWDLEQAKLAKAPPRGMFSGEVALITGAASGIGRACVESFLSRGAAVAGMDIDPKIADQMSRADFLGIEGDVTSENDLTNALEKTVDAFGGLDLLVLNAGIFPGGRKIEELSSEEWSRVMRVNVDANLMLLRIAYPLLKQAPNGGRIAVIGSRNVAAPGLGAAAYSASKAALNQLARVVALEWAGDGIRINSLHPDAVFDTGLWTDDVIAARASHYGLSPAQYRKKNLLKTEITSRDVAELAAELCGPRFAKTTGAQIPVDGGSDRII
jgi:NAD(P)-dependent dehydrogenase (short-subunit alcohol dehydrogenase family)